MKIKNSKYILSESEYITAVKIVAENGKVYYEIPMKKDTRKKITKEEIIELKKKELNINEICRELDCSYTTLRKKLVEFFLTTKIGEVPDK